MAIKRAAPAVEAVAESPGNTTLAPAPPLPITSLSPVAESPAKKARLAPAPLPHVAESPVKKARLAPAPLPPKPMLPISAETGDADGEVAVFFGRLGPYCRSGLGDYIAEGGVVSGPAQPLAEMQPVQISEDQNDLQTFREPWNMHNCLASMRRTGMYEAGGSVWWFEDGTPDSKGESDSYLAAVGAEPTLGQFQSAGHFWSEDALNASSANAENRLFVFPGIFSTCVPDLVGIQKQVAAAETKTKSQVKATTALCCFSELPCLAGRAVLRSYQWAMVQAIEKDDKDMVRKLLQAGLSATIRMRLSVKRDDRIIDALVSAESIRCLKNAMVGGDSFMDFVAAICELDSAKRNMAGTAKGLKEALAPIGITFSGKPLSDMVIKAIKAISPFAAVGAIRAAYRNLERCNRSLGDQSKLMRVCQAICMRAPNPEDATKAMLACLDLLKVKLQVGDNLEGEITVGWLVGNKTEVGFVQQTMKRLALSEYLNTVNRAGLDHEESEEAAKIICDKVWHKVCSAHALYTHFSGVQPLATDVVEEATLPKGKNLALRVADGFEQFLAELPPVPAAFALLLKKSAWVTLTWT